MSCGFSPVCWLLGDPSPAGPRKRFDAAMVDLKAARASGDKPAERAALARMQAASNALRKASGKAIDTVNNIDNKIASVKGAFSFAGKTTAVIAVVFLVAMVLKK